MTVSLPDPTESFEQYSIVEWESPEVIALAASSTPSSLDLVNRVAQMILDKTLFSAHEQVNYPQLEELCSKLVTENLDRIKQIDDIGKISCFVFNKYKDLRISEILGMLRKQFPSLQLTPILEQRLRKMLDDRMDMLHDLPLSDRIKNVLKRRFPSQISDDFEPIFCKTAWENLNLR